MQSSIDGFAFHSFSSRPVPQRITKMQLSARFNLHESGRPRRQPTVLQPPPLSPSSAVSPQFASFRQLLEPPPPSPALPSLIPRHGKKLQPRHFKRLQKLLLWLGGVLLTVWYCISCLRSEKAPSFVDLGLTSHDGEALILPSVPAPAIVKDSKGKWRWTVSIPPTRGFPLRPREYATICAKSMEISMATSKLRHKKTTGHYPYSYKDPFFIDVQDADNEGVFGSGIGKMAHSVFEQGGPVCQKSLTYVLESGDAGIGKTLLALWQAYGLAKHEGRAFFIDDSNWAYGKYETYFKPPPKPDCIRPPSKYILPCPHSAQHLVVSAATIRYTFGHGFNEEFEDAHKMEVYRQHNIYAMLKDGYDALFLLNEEDSVALQERKEEISKTGQLVVGMHIRRGDCHPYEFQYQKGYIPVDRYVSTAQSLLAISSKSSETESSSSSSSSSTASSKPEGILLAASDDPDVYFAPELQAANVYRAQLKFMMESKTQKDANKKTEESDRSILKGFSEVSLGWEGGFFSAVFWNLGKTFKSTAPATIKPSATGVDKSTKSDTAATAGGKNKASGSNPLSTKSGRVETNSDDNEHRNSTPDMPEKPSTEVLQVRSLLARAYILDLAVMAETASNGIVCTVSSSGCRILGVAMGWDKAIDQGLWKNVDGDWDWTGVQW
jgi:hypothetical protein